MLALTLLLVIIPTPSAQAAARVKPAASDVDRNIIYAKAISAVFPHWQFDEKRISLIVIENQTRIDSYDGPDIADAVIRGVLPSVSADVLADFRIKNASRTGLQPGPTLPIPWKAFDSSEMRGQFPAGGWFAFYQRYPGSPGLLSVSSIGFNERGDCALVYLAYAYSVDGGQGHIFFLKKRSAKWTIAKHDIVWVWVG
jgi:hypothetical protein